MARLEHVNITVNDPDAYAEMLCRLFGWQVRWAGPSRGDLGHSVHVGGAEDYIALYAEGGAEALPDPHRAPGGLNHLGVVVDDLDATEAAVKALGFEPHNHGDYEPGRRFYFDGPDGIEIEVVSYP